MVRHATRDWEPGSTGAIPPKGPSVDTNGGGGDDGGMEARVAKLEAVVEHIQIDIRDIKQDVRELRSDMRTDFRILFGAIITVALGLGGLLAHGFHWL